MESLSARSEACQLCVLVSADRVTLPVTGPPQRNSNTGARPPRTRARNALGPSVTGAILYTSYRLIIDVRGLCP
jgi:hypothetical protein